VKPSLEPIVHSFCLDVHNVGHKSWHEPTLQVTIGTPVAEAWVNLQANADIGATTGGNGNKGLDQRGNGVNKKRRLGLDPEAARLNGPIGDDVHTVVLQPLQQIGRVAVGRSARFCWNGTLPVEAGAETLLAIRAQPLHHGERTFDSDVFFLDVACDDGVFCNGAERWLDGACRAAPRAACDDGNSCTADVCRETTGECHWSIDDSRADCLECSGDRCVPDCAGKSCGADGCGGSCGTCRAGDACLIDTCVAATEIVGSCSRPVPLLPPTFAPVMLSESTPFEFTVTGSTLQSVNEVVPSCNSASDARDFVYTFDVPEGATWGIMATVHGTRADGGEYDTVLELRKGECRNDVDATVLCADDSTPPGGLASGVFGSIDGGKYFLFVDGYSLEEAGDFELYVRLYDTCEPVCDGAVCGGDDLCGSPCGSCPAGERCNAIHRCVAETCQPDCADRVCGDDGCGGKCGDCEPGLFCIFDKGVCVHPGEGITCNPLRPVCETDCGRGAYCTSECQCSSFADEVLPDMLVDRALLANEIVISKRVFPETSCAIEEACVGGSGARRLLRFTFGSVNQGNAPFVGGDPTEKPTLYFFSPCHAHYHFSRLATYELLDSWNRTVVLGRKAGYCLLDAEPKTDTPWRPCLPQFDCTNQGISPGWSDIYGNALDCQWLDITGVPPGTYKLRVGVNPYRVFAERSYANNLATHTFEIPADHEFESDALGPGALGIRNAIERKARAVAAEAVNRAGANRAHAVAEAVTLLKMWVGDLERACRATKNRDGKSDTSTSDSEATAGPCIELVHKVFDEARKELMDRRRNNKK
jgi:hypothetical protein